MKTELIMVGKTVDKLYTKGISDYQERIGHYMPFNITVIPMLKLIQDQKKMLDAQQAQIDGLKASVEALEAMTTQPAP